MREGTCPTCGAKTVEYKHAINKPMLMGLTLLYKAGGYIRPVKLKALGMNRNMWQNFTKLKYWNLIMQVDATSKWRLTYAGLNFLQGHVRIRKYVWTYRDEFVRFEGDHISFEDLVPVVEYKHREDYAREAIPHEQEKEIETAQTGSAVGLQTTNLPFGT